MKKEPSLKKQGKYLFIGKVLSFILRLFVPIVLVRILSKEDYGIYRQFNLITLTFTPILAMGLGSSLFYFHPLAKDDKKSVYIGQTYFLLGYVGALFLIIYIIFGKNINTLFGVETLNKYIIIIPVYILFMIISNLSNYIFTVEKRIKHNLIFYPTDILLRSILIIVFTVLYKNPSGCIHALLFYSLIRFLYITKYLFNHLTIAYDAFNISLVKKQLKYSIPFAGAIIINTIGTRIDKLLVNRYITTEEFAVYSMAFFSLPLINQIVESIQSVLVPKLSSHFNKHNLNEVVKLWKKAVTTIASLNIPLIIFFWIIAYDLFGFLYTDKYLKAATYFRIYIFIYFLHIFLRGVIFRASGKTKNIFIIDFICLPITIISGLLLISNFGVYGAIFTAIIGNGLPIIIRLIIEKNIMNLNINNWLEWKNIIKILLSSLIPIILIFLLKIFITKKVIFLLSSSIYFIFVIILQKLFGVFKFDDEIDAVRIKLLALKGKIWKNS